MKIRNSFVSNSSSSSFIIGFKNEPTEENMAKAFKISKDSPLYPIIKEIIKCYTNYDFEITDKESYKEYVKEDQCYDTIEEYEKENGDDISKLLEKNFTILIGNNATDSDNSIEAMLCEINIDYEDNELFIKSGGGY